jgi:citrate synthase
VNSTYASAAAALLGLFPGMDEKVMQMLAEIAIKNQT